MYRMNKISLQVFRLYKFPPSAFLCDPDSYRDSALSAVVHLRYAERALAKLAAEFIRTSMIQTKLLAVLNHNPDFSSNPAKAAHQSRKGFRALALLTLMLFQVR